MHSSGSLVDGRQISVQITRVGTTSRHFFSSSRNLSQRISVGTHVGHDDQDVQFLLVGQVLSSGQGQTGGDDTLDGWVVGQVQEEHHTLHRSVLLEVGLEETGDFHVDSHGCEHDAEVLLTVIGDVLALDEGGLSHDLGSDFVVGESVCREEGDLLSSGDGGHAVDGRDAGLQHLLGVDPLAGVDGLSLDVEELLGEDWGTLVDGGS